MPVKRLTRARTRVYYMRHKVRIISHTERGRGRERGIMNHFFSECVCVIVADAVVATAAAAAARPQTL